MKIKWYSVLATLVFAAFIFAGDKIVWFLDGGRGCRLQEEQMIETYFFNGIVEQKFYDQKNHRARTLKIDSKHMAQELEFQGLNQGFYEFVVEGDSVYKEKGQNLIYVYRDGIETKFQINMGCEN